MKLVFVMCTRGRSEDAQTARSVRAHKWEDVELVVLENNREGLSARYNRVLAERAGRDEVVVFIHDDVAIWDILLPRKVLQGVEQFGWTLVGIAGARTFAPLATRIGPITWMGGMGTQRHGAVEHDWGNGQSQIDVYGPTPGECAVIDGLFMAVDMRRIGNVRFDERFDFHFYDLDFCMSVRAAGLKIGVTNVHLMHLSVGDFGDAHQVAQKVFVAKLQASKG